MNPDNKDHGVMGPPTDVPVSQLWKALVDKIRNPGAYLQGIGKVECRDNDDGSVYREMHTSFAVMKENIYAFEDSHRVEFRMVDRPLVVVNRYVPEERAIEYRLETPEGKVVGWMDMDGAREGTYKAICGQYEKAKSL